MTKPAARGWSVRDLLATVRKITGSEFPVQARAGLAIRRLWVLMPPARRVSLAGDRNTRTLPAR
jgi:hypothetical protein